MSRTRGGQRTTRGRAVTAGAMLRPDRVCGGTRSAWHGRSAAAVGGVRRALVVGRRWWASGWGFGGGRARSGRDLGWVAGAGDGPPSGPGPRARPHEHSLTPQVLFRPRGHPASTCRTPHTSYNSHGRATALPRHCASPDPPPVIRAVSVGSVPRGRAGGVAGSCRRLPASAGVPVVGGQRAFLSRVPVFPCVERCPVPSGPCASGPCSEPCPARSRAPFRAVPVPRGTGRWSEAWAWHGCGARGACGWRVGVRPRRAAGVWAAGGNGCDSTLPSVLTFWMSAGARTKE